MLLTTGAVQAQDTTTARVDALLSAWDKADSPGAALAVIQNGQTVHSRGYGMAQLEYSVPNTATTVFHVASVSKQFTAFAIHLLAQDGKLSLDDEVRKHLPQLQIQVPFTIRHLIHHTSGLRDQWSLLMLSGARLDDVITEDDILRLLWQQKQLNFNPGEEELYSNSGYTLLAQIVQRVSGQSLAAFAKERIFEPLGMRNTHFHEHYGNLVKGRAYSYERAEGAWRYRALSYSNVGATSLFSTVHDLALWDQNFYSARVGGPDVQAAMLVSGKLTNGRETGYASGLVVGRYRGLRVVQHSGSDAGYRAHMLRFPAQKLSVVLLGNAANFNATQLAQRVADLYLEGTPGLEPPKRFPPEVALETRDLAPYLGDFEMRPGFLVTFTAESGQLMVQATGQDKYPLFAAADNRFFTKAFEATVTFTLPVGNAPVTTATWQQGTRDSPLKRITRDAPSAQALQACAGDYFSDELRTLYQLQERGGALWVRYPRGELELKPQTRDSFSAPFPLGVFSITRNASGACDGFEVTTGRVRKLRFERVRLVPGA